MTNYLSSVLLPFFIAWFFAYLLYPVVKFIETIRSRTQRIDFKKIETAEMEKALKNGTIIQKWSHNDLPDMAEIGDKPLETSQNRLSVHIYHE